MRDDDAAAAVSVLTDAIIDAIDETPPSITSLLLTSTLPSIIAFQVRYMTNANVDPARIMISIEHVY